MPLVSFTRATLRSAEFGFLGVVVYTRVHTPRRCGLPLSAAVFCLATLSWRRLRTSCWIVGIDRLSPALRLVRTPAPETSVYLASVPRGRACRPLQDPRGTASVPKGVGRTPAACPAGHASADALPDAHRHAERPDMGRAQVPKIPGMLTTGQNGGGYPLPV